MKTYKCSTCKIEKAEDSFYLKVDGTRSDRRCRGCLSKKNKMRWRKDIFHNRQRAMESYRRNRSKRLISMREWQRNLQRKVIEHYGGKCACCGEVEFLFLTLDHIDGKGAQHRKQFGGRYSGRKVYQWIIEQGYPKGFQILCFNCNCGKARNKNVCPHKTKSEKRSLDMDKQIRAS